MKNVQFITIETAKLLSTIGEITEDGKFNFATEAIKLWPHIWNIPGIVKAAKPAFEELKNLTDEQQKQLIKSVEDNLNLPNEKAEKITEAAIRWLLHTSQATFNIFQILKK
jgi:hypothetical protein